MIDGLTELPQKEKMLKIKKFTSENLQGQVQGEDIRSGEEGVYVEYIKLSKMNTSTADHGPGPSDGQECLKMRRPEGKKEEEASSTEGEYIEYITMPKNDSTEDVGLRQECHPEGRSEERRSSLRHREHSTEETESGSGQESLNMIDLGLPSSFAQRRTGEGEERTFECTVCEVTLTSVKTMEDHMNGKKHLKKSNDLKQKNSEQILSIVAVSNPPPTRLTKVLIT